MVLWWSSRTCFTLLSKGLGARGMFPSSLLGGDAVAAESCSGQYRHCLIFCLLAKTDQKDILVFHLPSCRAGFICIFPCRLRGWQSGNRASTDCRAPHLRFLSLARCSILRIHIRSGNCTAFGNIVFLR